MTNMNAASLAGRALYHAAWAVVGDEFYDTARLKNWADWEHKFDDLITDEDTARRFVVEMLDSLNDAYTRLLTADEVVTREEARTDTEESNVLVKRGRSNIGYVRIFSFSQRNIVEQLVEAMAEIAGCDGYIVDLRDNGGGNLNRTANCAELFVESGGIAVIDYRMKDGRMKTRQVGFRSDAFCVIQSIDGVEEDPDLYMRRSAVTAGKPIAVLINGGTASSAELLAAAILENGRESGMAVAIGEESHGKGIGQNEVDVLGKLTIKISDLRFYSPSGVWFGDARQSVCNAIQPDIHVQDIDAPGNHPVLDAASKWLAQRIGLAA